MALTSFSLEAAIMESNSTRPLFSLRGAVARSLPFTAITVVGNARCQELSLTVSAQPIREICKVVSMAVELVGPYCVLGSLPKHLFQLSLSLQLSRSISSGLEKS
jgi:hypothetical protein